MMKLPFGSTNIVPLEEELRMIGLTGGAVKPLSVERELAEATGMVNFDEADNEADNEAEIDFDDDDFDVEVAEDEDYDFSELESFGDTESNDVEEAIELIDSFSQLQEDETDQLSEDEVDSVVEALDVILESWDVLEERKKRKKHSFGHYKKPADAEDGFNRAPDSKLKMKLDRNLKIARRSIKKGKAKELVVMARAVSRALGDNYTLRGQLTGIGGTKKGPGGYSKKRQGKARSKLKQWIKDPEKARGGVTAAGGKLTGDRLIMRTRRTTRRKARAAAAKAKKAEAFDELNNLIESVNDIVEEPVFEGDYDTAMESFEQIIEGFEKIGASAEELANRVAGDIRETGVVEGEELEDDPRFEVGSFFESIARDAGACLDQLRAYDEDGDVVINPDIDLDEALEDLQSITSDLERGVEAADEID